MITCHVNGCPIGVDPGPPTIERLGYHTASAYAARAPVYERLYAKLTELRAAAQSSPMADLRALAGGSDGDHTRFWNAYPCFRMQVAGETPAARIMLHLAESADGAHTNSSNVNIVFGHVQEIYAQLTGGNPQADVAILGSTTSQIVHALLEENQWESGNQFVNLDHGSYREFKYRGDFLVWCVPNNILISVKSFYAAERLLASATGTDLVGFGFFLRPGEFNVDRTRTYQRAGFLAVYMPPTTLENVQIIHGGTIPANVNGTPFYRLNEEFGPDMARVYEQGITTL